MLKCLTLKKKYKSPEQKSAEYFYKRSQSLQVSQTTHIGARLGPIKRTEAQTERH